jgi:hypothetical protein
MYDFDKNALQSFLAHRFLSPCLMPAENFPKV